MQLAIFLLVLFEIIHSQRVKRQWGPSNFYQFEQWVNYVNRPRQPQFSVDNNRWGMPQYPAGNRNIQPHSAPNNWHLEQNPYWMNGYRPMSGYPQPRSRPPVVIETNVYQTNSRVPVPLSLPNGYGISPQLMGARGFQPTPSTTTITSTASTTTTTTSQTTTTTEDESEGFIQTAVKEDIDNVALVSPTTEEIAATTELASTTKKTVDLEASMNTRSTTLETTTTTTVETNTTGPLETTATTEFSSSDYNSVWSEGEPSSTFVASVASTTADKPDTTVTESEPSITQQESSTTSVPKTEAIVVTSTIPVTLETSTKPKNVIPEAEESPDLAASVTGTKTSTTSTTADPLISNSFQADLGLRPPPLPIDVLKRFQELGVSIEHSRF